MENKMHITKGDKCDLNFYVINFDTENHYISETNMSGLALNDAISKFKGLIEEHPSFNTMLGINYDNVSPALSKQKCGAVDLVKYVDGNLKLSSDYLYDSVIKNESIVTLNTVSRLREELGVIIEPQLNIPRKTDLPNSCAGYTITEAVEFTDYDGSSLGVVLGENKDNELVPYATWTYNFFPKSEHFSGFDNGHYCENRKDAIDDFVTRVNDKAKMKELKPVFNNVLDFDRKKKSFSVSSGEKLSLKQIAASAQERSKLTAAADGQEKAKRL